MLITVHPDRVAPAVLSLIDTVIAIGEAPDRFERRRIFETPSLVTLRVRL